MPMAIIGPTAAKVTPIITGMRMPKRQKPMACTSVAMPAASRSALMRKAMSAFERPSAPPTIRGTATVPAYITSTCCRLSAPQRMRGSFWSTPSPSPAGVFLSFENMGLFLPADDRRGSLGAGPSNAQSQ